MKVSIAKNRGNLFTLQRYLGKNGRADEGGSRSKKARGLICASRVITAGEPRGTNGLGRQEGKECEDRINSTS